MNDIEKVKDLFAMIPPAWDEIKSILSESSFTKEDLAVIALDVIGSCFCEYKWTRDYRGEEKTLDAMYSGYLIDSLQILLDYGFDPNTIIGDENVIWETQWVDAPDVGAAALRLLLEYGGNPNISIPYEPETLFEYIHFKVTEEEDAQDYFQIVQCWLVLMAFGGCWSNGEIPLSMLNGNSIEIFKSFELFGFTLEPLPQEPGRSGCWIMHIFRKDTKEEVAVY